MRKLIFIAMIVVFVPNAFAGLTGLGFGVHGGLISGYKNPILRDAIQIQYQSFKLTGDMFDIGAHLNIGTLRVIEIDVELDYAWKKQEIISGVDLTFSDFSVTGSVRKSIKLGILKPYAGAGIGLHTVAYSLDFGGQTVGVVLPGNESKTGYLLKAGLELDIPVFPLTPYGEWRYNAIQTTGKSTKYTSIIFGITLNLP